MISLGKIKTGSKIIVEGEPIVVLSAQHSTIGRGGAVLKTKLKNLKTGAIVSKTFQGSDKLEEAQIETQKAQHLYREDDIFYFMNNETYEQFELSGQVLGQSTQLLKEGTEVDILYFDSAPINIELPIKMEFEVVEAPPAVKGNTADGGSKIVTLETGIKISVPLFVKTGDKVRINTQTGEYSERVG